LENICIAVDAMGGDHGVSVTVPAVTRALQHIPNLSILLVGDIGAIEKQMQLSNLVASDRLSLIPASQMVASDDLPSVALRAKKDSSMRVAINQISQGSAMACVSSGNTGALMAIARFVLKTLPGVDRPAILFPLPSVNGPVYMLDLGANVDCSAAHLFQFAVMGSVLIQAVTGSDALPRVGLLNIGSEAIKGTDAVKQAAQLLSEAEDINYTGFIEGDDIYKSVVDLVVCDGFVGNVALKASEGVAKMILKFAKEEFNKNIFYKLLGALCYPVLKNLYKRFDPNNYNGASLLGLQGVVVKSHGGANESAFFEAITRAVTEVHMNVPEKIKQVVAKQLGEPVL
jgi:glycerol-3-phosphate acyltransferase PlsX